MLTDRTESELARPAPPPAKQESQVRLKRLASVHTVVERGGHTLSTRALCSPAEEAARDRRRARHGI